MEELDQRYEAAHGHPPLNSTVQLAHDYALKQHQKAAARAQYYAAQQAAATAAAARVGAAAAGAKGSHPPAKGSHKRKASSSAQRRSRSRARGSSSSSSSSPRNRQPPEMPGLLPLQPATQQAAAPAGQAMSSGRPLLPTQPAPGRAPSRLPRPAVSSAPPQYLWSPQAHYAGLPCRVCPNSKSAVRRCHV